MTQEPIPMRLPCPACGALHIDGPADDGTDWSKKPHATHACQFCGAVWRPAVVMTVGVRFLPGFRNDVAHEPRAMTPAEAERIVGRCVYELIRRFGKDVVGSMTIELGLAEAGRLELSAKWPDGSAHHVYRAGTPDELVAKVAAGECEP